MNYTVVDGAILSVGMWPQTEKTALPECIVKWKWLVEYLASGATSVPFASASSCSLCRIFLERDCVGCPVMVKTGEAGCVDTPYEEYCDEDDVKRALRFAKREVRFLRSLKKRKSRNEKVHT